jgi:hypothetical protein
LILIFQSEQNLENIEYNVKNNISVLKKLLDDLENKNKRPEEKMNDMFIFFFILIYIFFHFFIKIYILFITIFPK